VRSGERADEPWADGGQAILAIKVAPRAGTVMELKIVGALP
jgi:hypothetical protein